jgi:hypothetical protein
LSVGAIRLFDANYAVEKHQAQTTTAAKPTTAMRVALAAIKGDRTIADWRVNSGSIRSYAERII